MIKTIVLMICLAAYAAQAQTDRTYHYVYNCDSCGTFETISNQTIDLETTVQLSTTTLPDTGQSTLAQFTTVASRKAQPVQYKIKDNAEVYAYPNPATNQLFVNITTIKAEKVSMQLFDGLGRSVMAIEKELNTGIHVLEVPIALVPAGPYILKVIGSQNIIFKKVVKK